MKLSNVVRPAFADLADLAALRRVRIDVVEMLEVRRILEVAENGEAVAGRSRCKAGNAKTVTSAVSTGKTQGAANAAVTSGFSPATPHRAHWLLTAASAFSLSASIHQVWM